MVDEQLDQTEHDQITGAEVVDGELILRRYDGSQLNVTEALGGVSGPNPWWVQSIAAVAIEGVPGALPLAGFERAFLNHLDVGIPSAPVAAVVTLPNRVTNGIFLGQTGVYFNSPLLEATGFSYVLRKYADADGTLIAPVISTINSTAVSAPAELVPDSGLYVSVPTFASRDDAEVTVVGATGVITLKAIGYVSCVLTVTMALA